MASSGQTTSAAVSTVLGSTAVAGPVQVKALTTNTGIVYIGNNGSNAVTAATGTPLLAGDSIVYSYLANLSSKYILAVVSGEGVSWEMLSNT